MDEEVSPLERDHSLSVVLPGGLEKTTTVHGSKPVMDLLVTLCASYRLSPSDYTVEVLSPNKNTIGFKPNSPIGSLDTEKIVLKPKGAEEKLRKPYIPEATVRLLINYNKSHKAVVRVNPRVPLGTLLPLVCDKCEFRAESVVLLRDSESDEPLDLSRTLNEHGLREVFAKDTAEEECGVLQRPTSAVVAPAKGPSDPPLQDLPRKEKKKSESKGFLSLFRKQRKNPELDQAVSVPAFPGLAKQRSVSVSSQDVASSLNPPPDLPKKKRRAPQPPLGASQSITNSLGTCHLREPQRSESTLRSAKRRAPPPPAANHHQEAATAKDTLNPLEECDEPGSSSPLPSPPHLHKDSHRPTIRGKDLSDARSALAKVLTSSLSAGELVKRLKNSTSKTFPKRHDGTSSTSENEIQSVLNSNLPTENDWDDPAQRRGVTTFQVTPSKKPSDLEPTLDVVRPPDQSDGGEPTPSPDQEVETTSHSLPLDNQSSSTLPEVEDIVETPTRDEQASANDLKVEEESGQSHEELTSEGELNVEVVDVSSEESRDPKTPCEIKDDEDGFPPPPPPVYFSEDLEEGPSAGSVTNGHVCSAGEPPQNPHSPENSATNAVSDPSRFAQAVALAVQRSRLHKPDKPTGPQIPHESQSTAGSQKRPSYQYGA